MKSMKFFFALCAAVLITAATATSALCQSDPQSKSVNIAANVQAAISLTKVNDVDFGNIANNSSPKLVPNGSNQDVGSTAQFGKITVSGANNTGITITLDQSTVKLGDGTTGDGTLSFTPQIYGNNSSDNASSSSELSLSSKTASVTTSTSGNYYIYIGGTLSFSNLTASSGTFKSNASNGSGDLTVTVNYQ